MWGVFQNESKPLENGSLIYAHPLSPTTRQQCVLQVVTGDLVFEANEKHSYFITMTLRLEGTEISSRQRINLQDQMYHYLTSPQSAGQA